MFTLVHYWPCKVDKFPFYALNLAMWLSYRNVLRLQCEERTSRMKPRGKIWGVNVGLFYNIGIRLSWVKHPVLMFSFFFSLSSQVKHPMFQGKCSCFLSFSMFKSKPTESHHVKLDMTSTRQCLHPYPLKMSPPSPIITAKSTAKKEKHRRKRVFSPVICALRLGPYRVELRTKVFLYHSGSMYQHPSFFGSETLLMVIFIPL